MTPPHNLRGLPLLASVLVVLAVIVAAWNWIEGGRSQDRIAAAANVNLAATRVLSAMKDLEIGERGYLLFGDQQYLQPYTNALELLPPRLADLQRNRGLAVLPPEAGEPDLNQLVAAKIKLATNAIAVSQSAGTAAGKGTLASGIDKQSMDAIRAEVARIQASAERRIAIARRHEQLRGETATIGFLCLSLLACILFAAYAASRLRQERRAVALLDGVLENAPAGVGMLDRSLSFLRLNRILAGIGEHSVAPGNSLWELLGSAHQPLQARLRPVLASGRTVQNIEAEIATGGEPRQVAMSFYPLHDPRTRAIEGVGMIANDITARKAAERRLRQSEQRFRTLVDATASIIWTTEPDGKVSGEQLPWSRFTGQTQDQYTGWGWLEVIHPDDRIDTLAAWHAALADPAPLELEHRLLRRDGAWRHMALRAAPIRDLDNGQVREWVGSHADITERVMAERAMADAKAAAEAANLAKSQFIANMSHELRTPLSAVIGYSEMLAEEIEDIGQPQLLGDIHKIEHNARHLLSLINDVLDLSKIEANRLSVYAEQFSADALVDDVAGAVGSLMERNANTLDIIRVTPLGDVHTDQVKLRQCLLNLLSNAAKFTDHGRITITAGRQTHAGADWIELAVRDEGIGMTEEQVGRLFQRFAQADASTTRQFGGSGLGLAITRAFARKLGGDVTVASVAGQGSTFTLRIPAVMPADTGTETGPDGAAGPSVAPANGVLVVDDDPATRELLGRFLAREGFVVHSAADGREGLAAARRLRPRAILLDVTMPHLDGWSVLHAIRTDPEIGATPVVMVTVINEQSLGYSLGATDYLVKPIEWDALKRIVDRFRPHAGGDVLVVDDDADARARLRGMLNRNGWSVVEAANGREALLRVDAAMPALILLDLMMPQMDGFAFLKHFRTLPNTADIPVVVLSAKDITPQDRAELEPETDRILQKGSVTMQDLARELRQLAPPDQPPTQ